MLRIKKKLCFLENKKLDFKDPRNIIISVEEVEL